MKQLYRKASRWSESTRYRYGCRYIVEYHSALYCIYSVNQCRTYIHSLGTHCLHAWLNEWMKWIVSRTMVPRLRWLHVHSLGPPWIVREAAEVTNFPICVNCSALLPQDQTGLALRILLGVPWDVESCTRLVKVINCPWWFVVSGCRLYARVMHPVSLPPPGITRCWPCAEHPPSFHGPLIGAN